MVDVPSVNGYGDSQSLSVANPIPTATVFKGQVGWHGISKGQLQFSYPEGAMNSTQAKEMQTNLDVEQGKFQK